MDPQMVEAALNGQLFSTAGDVATLVRLAHEVVRPAAAQPAFDERLRTLMALDRAVGLWAESVFDRRLTGENGGPLTETLGDVFRDLDGREFFQLLDDLDEALLSRAGLDSDTRQAMIASAHFGREPLTIARADRTDIVLVNLTKLDAPLQTGLEALGVETLAGHVQQRFTTAVRVRVYDAQLDDLKQIVDWTIQAAPHILGLSVNIGGFAAVDQFWQAFAPSGQRPTLVFGGRGAEFYPDQLPQPPGCEAFTVPGWGEIALEDVVAYHRGERTLSEIRNIARYRSATDECWQVADWSVIESPDLNRAAPARRVNLPRYATFGANTLEIVRGCSFSACLFCPRPKASDRTMEYPFAMKLQELAYLSAMGVRSIPIIDEEFWEGAGGIRRKIPLLKGLIDWKHKGWIDPEMKFCADMRADTVCVAKKIEHETDESDWPLRLLREAGVRFVFVGIESLSQDMLDHMHKGTTVEQNIRAVEILRGEGFKFQAGSLGIAPLMKLEWLGDSLRRIRELQLAELADPSLTLILFGCSPYYRKYFQRDTPENRRHRQLLRTGSDPETPDLDALSGIPYRFQDERVGAVAQVHEFHDNEMYDVMKRLRAINAQLIYMGEENTRIHGEIWKWLSYGRMEIILWGMEQLFDVVSSPAWKQNLPRERQRVFDEMKRRKDYVETQLAAAIEGFAERSELTPQQATLVLPDHIL